MYKSVTVLYCVLFFQRGSEGIADFACRSDLLGTLNKGTGIWKWELCLLGFSRRCLVTRKLGSLFLDWTMLGKPRSSVRFLRDFAARCLDLMFGFWICRELKILCNSIFDFLCRSASDGRSCFDYSKLVFFLFSQGKKSNLHS